MRLDALIDAVSERIRHYVQTYYELDVQDIKLQKDTRREALEQERKVLAAQLEKRIQALKTLYLDKVAGVINEGQFVELNESFLNEKATWNGGWAKSIGRSKAGNHPHNTPT